MAFSIGDPDAEHFSTFKQIAGNSTLFIVLGAGLLAISSYLLFGGAGEVRSTEKALEQGRKVTIQLKAEVDALRALVLDEQFIAGAVSAVADPDDLQDLERLAGARLAQVEEVRVYQTDIVLEDFSHLGESQFIIVDMFSKAKVNQVAPVQMLKEQDKSYLAAAIRLGDEDQPVGFALVLSDSTAFLEKFDITMPDAGYIALEHLAPGFPGVVIASYGDAIPEGLFPLRLPIAGSLLRVVVPQKAEVAADTGMRDLLLFVVGGLLLGFGLFLRRRKPAPSLDISDSLDGFQPNEEESDTPAMLEPSELDQALGDVKKLEDKLGDESTEESIPLEDLHHELLKRHPHMQENESIVKISSEIFRAYDIRGIVGTSLDVGVALQIGQAVGSAVVDEDAGPIVVGRDGRHSGPALVDGLIEGILSTGCDVIDLGAVPTGVLYYAAYEYAKGSGVMVTGSHNPPDYNGFKIMIGGRTLSGEAITDLYRRIASDDIRSGRGVVNGQESLQPYIDRIAGDIQLARPLKVVSDCGNGIGGAVASDVLRAIGAEVIPLFEEVDGDFPNHHPDPSDPHNLEDLIREVAATGADLGVAFDGDADRLGVVTSEGDIVFSDRIMMLYAREVLSRNPGETIIYDVKCTGHLDTVIAEAGGKPEMYKTGHSLIKNRMKEVNAPFAGEMSGHFFFKDRWYGFDCGVYSACRLLEILAMDSRSPLEVLQDLPNSVSTPELKLEMSEGENHAFIEKFQEQARFEGARLTTIDGVRADFDFGWGLVRASNTTPILVLRFDADTEEGLNEVKRQFAEQILALDPSLTLPFDY